jgi:AraC family transcriptional regulator of arabinose operon
MPLSTLQRELALNSLEEVLLLTVREHLRERHQRPQLDERVQLILDLINHDLAALHSLETLAQAVALSPSRLSHLFKQEVGDSVNNLLLSLRLNKAARLLEFTTQSITTIADEVGFHSAFYFSRQFRQRFSLNPRAYRLSCEQRNRR